MSLVRIIGISAYYHDAAVCLIENGKIIFAAQEERFTRIKHDASFPAHALKYCLKENNLSLADVTAIVYYEKPLLKFERILNNFLDSAPKGLKAFINAMHIWTKDKLFLKKIIHQQLKDIDPAYNKKKTSLLFCNHHLSHAASAFYPSPFEEAAILTIDGVGEYTTTSLAYGHNSKIEVLKEIHYPHSIGLLYSSVTFFLGFKVNSDEYKVMGLAAYGNPDSKETRYFIDTIEQNLIQLNANGSYKLNQQHFTFEYGLTMINSKDWEKLFHIKERTAADSLTQSHCNLAYAFQKITEKAVLNLCREIKGLTNSMHLCLAGGVALNSVINGIIRNNNIFSEVFIQPASGDAGCALGAALAAYHLYFGKERFIQYPDALQNSLLGSTYTLEDINLISELHENHIVCADFNEVCRETAKLISEGKVIGWFQGRAEFGPRALGNRSILADARNPEMQKHLNLRIKNRESFRPFAPAVLEEDASIYFNLQGTSPYMLQVHQVNEHQLLPVNDTYIDLSLNEKLYTVKSKIPAVTHVDFSARIQTVSHSQHPLFWNLIHEFKLLTGVGMLINTSFNVKDEPIVNTPQDAYTCFQKTGMDILVIGCHIFFK